MRPKMIRGRQQISLNYLPGSIFDFDKSNTIAQVSSIEGKPNVDLNIDLVLQAVRRRALIWEENLSEIFHHSRSDQFVLLEPKKVIAKIYPKVLGCSNSSCGRVFDYSNSHGEFPSKCQVCKRGRLSQLRWIKIHRCGHVEPLTPPYSCKNCGISRRFALDTRHSEQLKDFRWICRACNHKVEVIDFFPCNACQHEWRTSQEESDSKLRRMFITPHRSGHVYYPHYVVMLNQPGSEMSDFLKLNDWHLITAAKFLEFPGYQEHKLAHLATQSQQNIHSQSKFGLSRLEVEDLQAVGLNETQIAYVQNMFASNRQTPISKQSSLNVGNTLFEQTGVPEEIWREAGTEILEAVLPQETGETKELFSSSEFSSSQQTPRKIVQHMGIEQLTLSTHFPVTRATFGYSRFTDVPNECQLNAFPADPIYQGKFPIFVNVVQGDAIIVRLNPKRVWQWLEENHFSPTISSNAKDTQRAKQAYFVQILGKISLEEPQTFQEWEAHTVFGLLHTMSHLFVRGASLLCGLNQTSLSEYILPRALTFAVYCTHKEGATIGALASLFENSLIEWLSQIQNDARHCVYDPVCRQQGGECHACTHLSEISCHFFNLNLGRRLLFGGPDKKLGRDLIGYFDPRFN